MSNIEDIFSDDDFLNEWNNSDLFKKKVLRTNAEEHIKKELGVENIDCDDEEFIQKVNQLHLGSKLIKMINFYCYLKRANFI